MKILFMTPDGSNDVSWSNVDYLEKAIGGMVECKWAGVGHKLHRPNENLNATILRVMPDADWVIVNASAQDYIPLKIPEKRICKAAYLTSDLHHPSPRQQLHLLNTGNWDAFLMHITKTNVSIDKETGTDHDFFINNLNAPILNISFSINPNIFKPIDGPKMYDVAFLGSYTILYYPLRRIIWEKLPQLAERNKWNILMRSRPIGPSFSKKRRIDLLLEQGHLVGDKYAEALASSKILLFSVIKYRYPVKKYFEGMASGCLVMADTPLNAEELHFIPDWNFVEINEDNWEKKLKYYLKHDAEREVIIRRGYETLMKYHTNDIRAKEIIAFLEKHS